MRHASDLTDREWSMVAPFMPAQPLRDRRRKTSQRAVMGDGGYQGPKRWIVERTLAWRGINQRLEPFTVSLNRFTALGLCLVAFPDG